MWPFTYPHTCTSKWIYEKRIKLQLQLQSNPLQLHKILFNITLPSTPRSTKLYFPLCFSESFVTVNPNYLTNITAFLINLFNDVLSSSDFIRQWVERQWIMTWTGYGRKRFWHNLTPCLRISLEGLYENHNNSFRWSCFKAESWTQCLSNTKQYST